MVAQKIDGNAIAKSIRENIHAQIDEIQKTNPRFRPSLKIIQGMCLQSTTAEDILTIL
jgi:methylenetetrahydrofolate dehydrogenase (NADP+)/methenyltetrahydrofolate cyclohydrolase/formyltetrahydrofolate synthetase